MGESTSLLASVSDGDGQTGEDLLPIVYEELRQLAAHQMASQPEGHTLQATALVHEAYLRLAGSHHPTWKNRSHFFRSAAEAMRRILIENARKKARQKRGGPNLQKVDLRHLNLAFEADDETLLIVHEALERLSRLAPIKAELVKMRFFIGLSNEESARVLQVSEATVKRYWEFSRAWLLREIRRLQDES